MGSTHDDWAGTNPPRNQREDDGYEPGMAGEPRPRWATLPAGGRPRRPVPRPYPTDDPRPGSRDSDVPPRRRDPRLRSPTRQGEFNPLPAEPFSARAPVPAGLPPGRGGRHTARGSGAGLPPRLAVDRAKHLRGRTLPAIVALVLMLGGAGVLGGTYLFDSVKLTSDLAFPATTTVLYSDGSVLAKLGEVTRYELRYDEIEEPVLQSIVASEDETFWTNEGVDLGSVVRAAWNNFTGGTTQGGSTITQQYARLAFDLDGVTYQRKAREAVLAWKMNRALTKQQILEAYLNAVPFGRQTYGIEAAARAFFGKTANKTAKPEEQLTWAESIVLVAMVKQPYPDPADPEGLPGYDPTVGPEAEANARARFDYVRGQLVAMGALTEADAAALVFPDNIRQYTVDGNGLESPAGIVVNHVLSELTYTEGSPFYGAKDWKFIREGGYQIHTTLNKGAQAAAEAAASRAVAGSPMSGQPANLQSALVAIQPGTGRVLAYYGGDDGKGADYAGFYVDEHGEATGVGRHPTGSSFKVYTLAAALRANISLRSYWEWNPHDMLGRTGARRIQNASTCGNLKAGDKAPCSLLQSTISSLNVPYYAVTLSVTPTKVLETARDMGIDYMWTDALERQDLRATDIRTVVPSRFDTVLGIGQYPITVLDHANGVATVASAGLRAKAHFVQTVTKGDDIVYGETLPPPDQPRVLTPQQANDLTFALSQVSSAKVNIGWDTAGKTGTWEYAPTPGENAHAWMVGFSRKIAAAVWVGNKGDEAPIRDKSNSKIYGAGLPASIWQSFMINATKAMNEPKVNTKFNAPNYVGDTMPPGAVPGPNGRENSNGTPTRTRR